MRKYNYDDLLSCYEHMISELTAGIQNAIGELKLQGHEPGSPVYNRLRFAVYEAWGEYPVPYHWFREGRIQ